MTATAPHPTLERYGRTEDERHRFLTSLFDRTAPHYDWICRVMSLGSGQAYRRQALSRHGLRAGMKVLDVATGTGLVARGALDIVGRAGDVIGLDPCSGMLAESRQALANPLVRGVGEALPFRDGEFDFLTMGYALRHVPTLETTFADYLRVLKPGGRVLILEISRPQSPAALTFARLYFQRIVPFITRLGTGSADAELLMQYYWDTIAACVPPDTILQALGQSGFEQVTHHVVGAIFSEYSGSKPAGSLM